MSDFSQHGEQPAILAWAQRQPSPGSFVDVGAYDGRTYSNVKALADRGWEGLCIEAAPDAAAACARYYADNPSVSVLCAALAVTSHRFQPLYWTPGEPFSSLDYAQIGAKKPVVPLLVAVLHPSDLMDLWSVLRRPRFASIDTEGTSLELFPVLRDWLGIDCVCLEVRSDQELALASSMLDGWHMLARTESNVIAARTPLPPA